MLTGLNHLTLAVTDLARSIDFYQQQLGLRLHARWNSGAYFSCGSLWLCLSVDTQVSDKRDYTHYAFSIAVSEFAGFVARLEAQGAVMWKDNKSEGESFYFLDPDGHRLELHVGDLAQRVAACREKPYAGMVFFD
ncbi:fosfomycin resistance glutathione transferase [Scandinavium sp. V105_16]|uniref:Fosfomycin resistance glutathione transferase n=1 Tax=Scandinavium lactucae TaxID=3095028 RepID=A0AAJ2S143_9ENTR|nr:MULTISPECIES: fosfomycin resistance glutathione transferase [unclassified Scandinavium]MDX6021620.1 fosfomycin resistance glutathione transferase [Scandinavium sp. V105_16]MDX6031785.1 fosfomycin resistance glutathione transferase [Scandinavium sp. V105_12]MDX6038697.1 fosfomycin resistance glutathione transferase [Scandinavium sp. V105_6]MDX6049347.1 fosfomycin resistance glutathione transferase [Scandinavium sp. V105_1]